VAGLFWLKNGENRVGTASFNEIDLPPQSAPARVGRFLFRGGRTVFTAEPGVEVLSGGGPVGTLEMKPDVPGPADTIRIGSLSMFVIQRGNRFAIRLRDTNSSLRREFTGLRWFEVDENWRLRAKWSPTPGEKSLRAQHRRYTEQAVCPGYAAFRIAARTTAWSPPRRAISSSSSFGI